MAVAKVASASKKKSNGYGKGTFIETKMFLSPAFFQLGVKGGSPTVSSQSVKVLVMFLGKRQFGNGKDRKGNKISVRKDDNRFNMTYKELASHGIKQTAGTRCIDELLAKGFIKVIDPGGAYDQHKAVYALIDEWQSWKLGDQPVSLRKKDVKRGYQGKRPVKDSNAANVIPFERKQILPSSTMDTHTIVDDAHPIDGRHR